MTLRIQLLGEFRLWRGPSPIDPKEWKTEKAKTLLKILLTKPGRVFTADELIEYLWPEADPARAAVSLRGRVSELRHILEPDLKRGSDSRYILTERQGYSFNSHADYWLDVAEFAQHVRRAATLEQEGNYEEAIAEYQAAVELYKGDYLPEERYEDWAIAQAERWREIYLDLLSHLAECHARLGQYRRAIARCHQALGKERYRESLYRQLIVYCYLAGNQAEALRVCERCRELLIQELNTGLARETEELCQRIRQRHLPEVDQVYPTPRIERHPIPYSLGRTPFVGREEELSWLAQYLEQVQSGKGSIVLIAGEVGVGKTRLGEEFIGYARNAAKVKVLRGYCRELEIKLAYQSLVEALRSSLSESVPEAFQEVTPLWLAEVAQLVPELRERMPDLPLNPALPPEQERGRLFEGIAQFLIGLARRTPLIVFLDDLQWIDPSTCDFLHYFTPRLHTQPILLLGTYRSEEVGEGHPLTNLIREGRSSFHLIELRRLSSQEVEQLLRNLAPSLNKLFHRRIYEETEGNPFFIVSILQNLFEEGALKVDERGRWVTDIDDITLNYRELMIPPGIREAIRRRLSVLAEDERRFLKLAAIIGRELDLTLLGQVWGGEGRDEVELVERLLETNLIIEAEGRYEFSHPKITEVTYGEIGRERRRGWHRRIGEEMEELYAGRIEKYYDLLAHHFCLAEEWQKALDYLVKAGSRAKDTYANQEALGFFRRALELVEKMEAMGYGKVELWKKRFESLSNRAGVYDILGMRRKQQEDLEELFDLATKLEDDLRLSEAHRGKAAFYIALGQYRKAKEEAFKGLEIKRKIGDKRGEGIILNTIGVIYKHLGKHSTALEYLGQADEINREVGNKRAEGVGLLQKGVIHRYSGNYEKALQCLTAARELFEEIGDKKEERNTLGSIGAIHWNLGEYSDALEHFQRACEMSREIGDRKGEGIGLNDIGALYIDLGMYDRAMAYHRRALIQREEIGDRKGEGFSRYNIGITYKYLQQYDKALEQLALACEISRMIGDRLREGFNLNEIGLIHRELGNYEEALQCLDQVTELNKELENPTLEIENLAYKSSTCRDLGRMEEALDYSSRAIELLESGRSCEYPQAVYFHHAKLLLAHGLEDESARFLRKAHDEVMERADGIKDPEMRKSFLQNVQVNREIVEEWERTSTS